MYNQSSVAVSLKLVLVWLSAQGSTAHLCSLCFPLIITNDQHPLLPPPGYAKFDGCRCPVAAFIPLNPQALPAPQPDIYPGLSGPLSVPAEEWNSYGLSIPDNATLRFIYNQGRQDAVAWASKAGFGEPAKLQAVLRSTAAPSDAVLLVGPARGLH